MKPFDILAIVNDALEEAEESRSGPMHDSFAAVGTADLGDLQEIKMALKSKLDSTQLQTFLKGKANISYVENKMQDLEMHIEVAPHFLSNCTFSLTNKNG
jgi:hypothetical protein